MIALSTKRTVVNGNFKISLKLKAAPQLTRYNHGIFVNYVDAHGLRVKAATSADKRDASSGGQNLTKVPGSKYSYHGAGLSNIYENKIPATKVRSAMSNFLRERLMSHEKSKVQLASRLIYSDIDRLNPRLLDFFYATCNVPQNFQTWFAITQLHLWMTQTRFRAEEGKSTQMMINSLIDHLTTDIEIKLLNSGITNSRIYERYLKDLISFHYGCVLAYDEGFDTNDAILASAIWRNIYTMNEDVRPVQLENMVGYVRQQMSNLYKQDAENLFKGRITLSL